MKIERKTFSAAEFKATDAAQGIAEMIVSVFGNVDAGNEVVVPGFFAESLASRRTADGRPRAKGVWGHDWLTPIAKTLDAQELLPGDPRLPVALKSLGGLWIKGQFNLDTQRGREAFSDLQFGSIDEFSFGFQVNQDRWTDGRRYLVKGEFLEWSPVLVGMNPDTMLLGTKAAVPTDSKAVDFNTVRANTQAEEDLWDLRWELQSALRQSVDSILSDDMLDASTKLAMIRTSIAQYGEALVNWASQALALVAMGIDVGFDGLESSEHKGRPYAEQVEAVLAAVTSLHGRSKALAALRSQSKEGRTLSTANRDKLASLLEALGSVATEITDLLAATEPPKALPLDYLERRLRASALSLATTH